MWQEGKGNIFSLQHQDLMEIFVLFKWAVYGYLNSLSPVIFRVLPCTRFLSYWIEERRNSVKKEKVPSFCGETTKLRRCSVPFDRVWYCSLFLSLSLFLLGSIRAFWFCLSSTTLYNIHYSDHLFQISAIFKPHTSLYSLVYRQSCVEVLASC